MRGISMLFVQFIALLSISGSLIPVLSNETTTAPTMAPIALSAISSAPSMPTVMPTILTNPEFSFESVCEIQGFEGTTSGTKVSMTYAEKLTIAQSVSASMGLPEDYTKFLAARAYTVRRSLRVTDITRSLATANIAVTTKTTLNIFNYANYPQNLTGMVEVYDVLTYQLTAAASSGSLTSMIQAKAVTNAAAGLYAVTAPVAYSQKFEIVTYSDNNNENNELSGLITGMVIMGIVLIFVCIFATYYYSHRGSRATEFTQVPPTEQQKEVATADTSANQSPNAVTDDVFRAGGSVNGSVSGM